MTIALLLSALAVVSGVIYIWASEHGSNFQRYLFKPLTTLLILGLALTLPEPVSAVYRWLVAAGLLFSMAGDIFLMLPADRFVLGLVSFLVAHILYILAYVSRGGFQFTWWLLIPYLAYGFILLYLLWPHTGAMRIPVIIYALVLLVMGWQAAEQWWDFRNASALLAMVGALLFLASDSILALNKFRQAIPHERIWVMITYYSAQFLIAWSVSTAGLGVVNG